MTNSSLVTNGIGSLERRVIHIIRALLDAMEEGFASKATAGTKRGNLVPRLVLTSVGPLPPRNHRREKTDLLMLIPLLEPTDLLAERVQVRSPN